MIIQINKAIQESLTKTELAIIQYINENVNELHKLSIVDIAEESYTSPSTVSRAIRKCGLHGFNELRHRLNETVDDKELYQLGEIMNKSVIEAQTLIERISVTEVLNISKELLKANRIYVLARGASEYVGEEFSFKLQLMNLNSMFICDPDIMRKKANKVTENDLIFIFSLNGNTQELLDVVQTASLTKCKVISCCCNQHSELFSFSDLYILGYRHKHISITDFEVASRVSLFMISRIITDYLVSYINENSLDNI